MGFSFSPGMGPRGAMRQMGEERAEQGRFFDRAVVVGMLAFLRPYRRQMVAGALLMLLVTAFTLLTPYLIKVAIDGPITSGDPAALWPPVIAVALGYLGLFAASAGQQYLLGRVGQRVLADVRAALFAHLQRLSLGYHDRTIAGVTVSRVINDVAAINDLLTQGLITIAGDVLVLAGIVIVMLSLSPRLALFTFAVLPLMGLATFLFSREATGAFRLIRRRVAILIGALAENIAAIRVIQAFAQEEAVAGRFDAVNGANRNAHVEAMHLSFIFLPSIEFLGILATAIVLFFGGRAVAGGEVTLGIMVAFIAYVTRFFQPIQELSRLYTTLQSAMAGGEEVLRLLNTTPAVVDRPDAAEMPSIRGAIVFDHVSFRYRSANRPTLDRVSLAVAPGQTVALVGPTGAGKTTIANVVARFYEVDDGRLLIDGIDIRDVTQASLRRQFGLVPQDPFLFAGSIADNIRYGRPDAPLADVIAAAELANAHSFISALPDGYDTPILEGAVNLSVGQRQLLCIARAALVNPRILILDEATANIDTVTELLIQSALARLMAGRTAVVIAHRLSTIRNADLICVVQNGRITEQGTHEELLDLDSLYSTLHSRQIVDS